MRKEEWIPVVGYEGLYMVSNLGRVKSLNYKRTGKEKILTPVTNKKDKQGYYRVPLSKNGEKKNVLVHILVAEAFIPNPLNLPEVNHIDENTLNNNVDNLEWCTKKENANHGTRNQRISEKMTNGKQSKQVRQKNLDGDIVKDWPSTMEIERQLGFSNKHISRCCRGERKKSHGFLWEYI